MQPPVGSGSQGEQFILLQQGDQAKYESCQDARGPLRIGAQPPPSAPISRCRGWDKEKRENAFVACQDRGVMEGCSAHSLLRGTSRVRALSQSSLSQSSALVRHAVSLQWALPPSEGQHYVPPLRTVFSLCYLNFSIYGAVDSLTELTSKETDVKPKHVKGAWLGYGVQAGEATHAHYEPSVSLCSGKIYRHERHNYLHYTVMQKRK